MKTLKHLSGIDPTWLSMSTLVTSGRGEGVVVATARESEIGKIAKILDEDIEEMTPLQKRLEELGKKTGIVGDSNMHSHY